MADHLNTFRASPRTASRETAAPVVVTPSAGAATGLKPIGPLLAKIVERARK